MKNHTTTIALTAILALSAGCASVGYKQAQDTSASLQQAAESIHESIAPMETVLVTLNDLVKNPGEDITQQFESFSSAVSTLQASAKEVTDHAQSMQADGEAYFANWESELDKIENNQIKVNSRERKNAVAKEFTQVSDRYARTAARLRPFVSNLTDIRTVLATDLTAGGLESIRGQLRGANAEAESLRESLMELSSDFRELGVSLSPSASIASTGP